MAVDEAPAAELATTATPEAALRVDDAAGTGDPVAIATAVEDWTVEVATGAEESPERADTAAVAAVKAELSVDLFAQGMIKGMRTLDGKDRQVVKIVNDQRVE